MRKQAAKDPDFAAKLREKRKVERKEAVKAEIKQKKKNKEATDVDSGNDKVETIKENQNTPGDESDQYEIEPIVKSKANQW